MTAVMSAQRIRLLVPEGSVICNRGIATSFSLQRGSGFKRKLISSYICSFGSVYMFSSAFVLGCFTFGRRDTE
jgi:hypothetical protein